MKSIMITANHPLFATEQNILEALSNSGPVTGQELCALLGGSNSIDLWRACYESNLIRVTNCARYYLRYDITRENQIRLSPSILRDFLTFSVIFLPQQRVSALEHSARLANKHRKISRYKIKIARQAIMSIDNDVRAELNQHACSFVAGDVAYFLGHDTKRKHSLFKTIIHGSDIDILFVYNHQLEASVIEAAETQMLSFKNAALKSEGLGEEIDFLFKPVSKMLSQFAYSDIHEKIACKILYESFYIFGNSKIYDSLTTGLELSGTRERIENDFETALAERKETFRKIFELTSSGSYEIDENVSSLFYFSQERLEFT